MCVENASSFEESIKIYESWGDSVKISINPNSWINSIPIYDLVSKLIDLIRWNFCEELGISLSQIGIEESYPYRPVGIVEPGTLLPQAGEMPEKLISLISSFKQKALDLSIGVNPFTTFIFYSRTIPMLILMEFLKCNVNEITRLANFLGLKAYSMIDQKEVSLPTKSPDKVILMSSRDSLSYKILEIQKFLVRINPVIKEVSENFTKEAINQISVSFEPWEEYKTIFTFFSEILKDRNWCRLDVENGRIVKIKSSYKEVQLPHKVWLRDFLIKIYPIVSVGIINFSYSMTELEFHPLAKDWIDKVIKNEGKAQIQRDVKA
jgi:hypothetical protein